MSVDPLEPITVLPLLPAAKAPTWATESRTKSRVPPFTVNEEVTGDPRFKVPAPSVTRIEPALTDSTCDSPPKSVKVRLPVRSTLPRFKCPWALSKAKLCPFWSLTSPFSAIPFPESCLLPVNRIGSLLVRSKVPPTAKSLAKVNRPLLPVRAFKEAISTGTAKPPADSDSWSRVRSPAVANSTSPAVPKRMAWKLLSARFNRIG